MKSEVHLNISDLLAFRERRLEGPRRSAAAAHLVQCPECRDRLPRPTADEFWKAVLGDEAEPLGTTSISTPWASTKTYLSGAMLDHPTIRNAVVSSVLLIAVLGFCLLLMMPEGSPVDKSLVAVTSNDSHGAQDPTQPGPRIDDGRSNTGVSSSFPGSERGRSNRPDQKRAIEKQAANVRGLDRDLRLRQRAETRGKDQCGGRFFVALEAKQTEAGLLLWWEKIRGVVAYNIYLSDLDERLIGHFETSDKTTYYLVTATLDSDTTYRLRLVAALENGGSVVSESQTFKVGDLGKGSKKSGNLSFRRKTSASVRCLEVKQ